MSDQIGRDPRLDTPVPVPENPGFISITTSDGKRIESGNDLTLASKWAQHEHSIRGGDWFAFTPDKRRDETQKALDELRRQFWGIDIPMPPGAPSAAVQAIVRGRLRQESRQSFLDSGVTPEQVDTAMAKLDEIGDEYAARLRAWNTFLPTEN